MTRSYSPSAAETIQALFDYHLENLHVAAPGRIERYDAGTQRADVQPLVRHAVEQPDGSTVYEASPVLPSVPVLHPRSGSWFVALPVAAGDTGLILYCSEDWAGWWDGQGDLRNPIDLRRHDRSHAVFLPVGFVRRAQPLAGASATDMVAGQDGGSTIRIKPDGTIELAGGAQFVALANLVTSQLTTLKAAIGSAGVTTGDGGLAFKTALVAALTTWPGNIASTKTKAT